MQTSLFLLIVEIAGTIAFAISGIRLAAAKNFDWFGAYVVGLVTAIGGGTLRDVLLGTTPFWMQNGWYMGVTGLSLLFVIVFRRQWVRLNSTFFIFDTIGLALFVVIGMQKTLMFGYPVWTAIIMGTLTGAFGGVLRDILINEVPLIWHGMHCRRSGVLGRDAVRMQAGDAAGGMCRHCCGDTPACGQIQLANPCN